MTDTVTVPANLMRYVRRGLHAEFSAGAERVSLIEFQDLTEEQFDAALETLDAVRALLKNVGFVDEGSGHDIDLDISPDPFSISSPLMSRWSTPGRSPGLRARPSGSLPYECRACWAGRRVSLPAVIDPRDGYW